MASYQVIGFIDALRMLPDACILFVSEFKKGYKKPSGEIVEDRYISWKILFKGYFKKYLAEHFGKGMLVEVKGEVLPYAIENGEVSEGLTVLGQTCNAYSYPRSGVKQEQKMIKDSQLHGNGTPDLDAYNQPDF